MIAFNLDIFFLPPLLLVVLRLDRRTYYESRMDPPVKPEGDEKRKKASATVFIFGADL